MHPANSQPVVRVMDNNIGRGAIQARSRPHARPQRPAPTTTALRLGALLLAVAATGPVVSSAKLHGRRAAAAAAASTADLDFATASPCGPANATHFGLRCAWEAARAPGPTITIAASAPGYSGGHGGSASGGVPFTFQTPPQCCCTQLMAGSGDKPLRRLWASDGARCFPHAIVVGAQKGGTTALFAHFMMRPDFEAPDGKEVRWGVGGSQFVLHFKIDP